MTATAEAGAFRPGPGDRIGTATLLGGAVREVRQRFWPLVALWLIMGLITVLVERAGGAVTPPPGAGPALTLTGVVKGTLSALLGGVEAAIGLRILLQGPARWRNLDRPLLECTTIMVVMGLAFAAPSWLYGLLGLMGLQMNPAAAGLVFMVVMIAAFYITVRLVLWPVGRLMARPEVTAARSWRLMRRATRSYVLSHILLFLPLVVTFAGVYVAQGEAGLESPLVEGANGFVTVAIAIMSTAIDATIYRLRVENPATVADVFD